MIYPDKMLTVPTLMFHRVGSQCVSPPIFNNSFKYGHFLYVCSCVWRPSSTQMTDDTMQSYLTKLFISPPAFIRLTRRSLPRVQPIGLRPRCPMMTTVTRAVTPSGEAIAPATDNFHILERSVIPQNHTVTLLLNRPKVLNALTRDMFLSLYHRLHYFDRQTNTPCVLLRSSEEGGRAFCAGGDVRSLYQAHHDQGDYYAGDEMFRAEYRLTSLLAQLKHTSVAAIMDGITMGGGLGLAIHGRWRIATERTVAAMPECMLGLQPDVGVCSAFPRLPIPGLGAYLALTGARISGKDTVLAGIATHFVPSEALHDLYTELERDGREAESTLEKYSVPIPQKELPHQSVIEKCFVKETLEEVVSSLEDVAEQEKEEDAKFAKESLEKIRAGCPTAVKVTWEGLKRGANKLSFDDWMTIEFRLATRMIRRDDFSSGVKSALITKDRAPIWCPARLEDVTDSDVQKFFAPLSEDLGIAEIDLRHGSNVSCIAERPKL